MTTRDHVRSVIRRWPVVLAGLLIGAAAALIYDASLPVLYRATSGVFVSIQRGETTSELVQGSTFTQANVQSYAQLAAAPIVLAPVIERLDLDITPSALARAVTVETPLNTVIIEITVQSPSPEKAAEIADAITASLSETVAELAPRDSTGEPSISMTTIAPAQVPRSPFAPNSRFIVATGVAGGLAAGVFSALLWGMLDTRLRTEADVGRLTDAPVIGAVPRRRPMSSPPLVLKSDPYGAPAEAYRRIRANLEYADLDRRIRSLTVTSALPGDGKTTTAINLALAMAERTDRVLLVEADLRRPSIASRLQIDGSIGLTTVLLGEVPLHDAVVRWGDAIDVLPSGDLPPNPSQVLASEAMADLVKRMTEHYDIVIVDSPPLLPASDAIQLAHLTDGAIVIAKYKGTRRAHLATALGSLRSASATIIGVVLDRVKPSRSERYYGYIAEQQENEPRETAREDASREGATSAGGTGQPDRRSPADVDA